MVTLAGDLVAGRLAGDFDGSEPAIRNERVDVAIDGGHADVFNDILGGGERLVGGEGASGTLEGGADGVFLSCFSESEGHV